MFAELSATSNFTFLHGASHPEEYMRRAALLGIGAVAIADENSVAGIVRAHTEAKEIARAVRLRQEAPLIGAPRPDHIVKPASADILNIPRLLPAAKIVTRDGFTVTTLPKDRQGWANLCRLLTTGRLRAEKGDCDLKLEDLLQWGADQTLLLHPPKAQPVQTGAGEWWQKAQRLTRRFPENCYLLMTPLYDGHERARFDRLADVAQALNISTVATALPRMHHGRRRKLADVVTAIREGIKVDDLGKAALCNAEARLRSEAEMRSLFQGHEGAVDRTIEIAEALTFKLDHLKYEYPSEVAEGEAPADRLRRLTREGLQWRYPAGIPAKVEKLAEHELTLIAKLDYEPYFLTVSDVVRFARSRNILCQGRGSAANSVVCYALGVTSVSPEVGTMVFERFVSEARNEPPGYRRGFRTRTPRRGDPAHL